MGRVIVVKSDPRKDYFEWLVAAGAAGSFAAVAGDAGLGVSAAFLRANFIALDFSANLSCDPRNSPNFAAL